MGAGVTNPRRISSSITLMSAVRAAAAPTAHSFFPCLEYRAVSIMQGKLGVEKEKYIREGGRAPSEAVVRRPAVTTAAVILYTCLTAGVFNKKGSPQGQVCIDHVVCHGANNRAVFLVGGPEAIVDATGVPAGMCI